MSGNSSRRRRHDAMLAAGLGMAIAGIAAGTASAQSPQVVADGLANPRGMTFTPDGRLYVAEAGRGGKGKCVEGPEGNQCYGATGAISRVNVRTGRVTRVLKGLPSLAVQTGETPGGDATGPHDVSFDGRRGYFVIGLGGNPAARSTLGSGGRRFAGLYRIGTRGRYSRVADLGAYEARANPDAGQPEAEVDTNPYSLDASAGERILVTDAGGNDVLRVGRSGRVATYSVFTPFRQTPAPPFLNLPPGTNIPYQPVPTGLVRVPGKGAYVGQLTGFPFPVGAANVYQVRGGAPKVVASGFTTVVDVAYHNRSLYVLQISSTGLAGPPSPGKLIKVAADGKQTELAAGQLQEPTGLAVAKNGDVYVGNKGGSGSDAEIVRIAAAD